jgi:phytoene dehydrogenase-like protein
MDVVVVGGGLAGLSAAAYLARAGRSVLVLEKASAPGGRARTRERDGFLLNLGPHALYRAGEGMGVLRDLDVQVSGGIPSGGHAVNEGRLHTLPVGPASLLATGLLPLGAKLELARLLARLPRIDTAPLARTTVAQWLERISSRGEVRALLAALLRVSTYVHAPDVQSAGDAVAQLQRALRGVLYLDGGWQVLVDGLRLAATRAGARIRPRARVTALAERSGRVSGVRLVTGEVVPAEAVVIAAEPDTAFGLVGDPGTSRLPACAACLDVGLRRLPNPGGRFALGIDRPLYLSVHSVYGRLAPEGAALVHVMRYLGRAPAKDEVAVERELEGLLDRVQPGWRAEVAHRRFLPRLVVSHDVGSAAGGGLAGRSAVRVPGREGVFLAGDWVGPEGLLADAALASGRAAARAALEDAARRAPAA